MEAKPDYAVQHWTYAIAMHNYQASDPLVVTVNNRAATREAIIRQVRHNRLEFIERSDWRAHKNRTKKMKDDWDYSKIAIHHAGRSYSCGPAALQLLEIQDKQMSTVPTDDIGYHYAVDCYGNIYEGRDIRFKGENVKDHNTGVIGIVLLENLTTPEEGADGVARTRTFLDRLGFNQTPTVPSLQADGAKILVSVLKEFFQITTLGGHREFPEQLGEGKICPGNIGMAFASELRKSTGLAAP